MYYWWYSFLCSYLLQDDPWYHHIQALHVFLTPLNKKHALNIMFCLFPEKIIPMEVQTDMFDTLVKGNL